MIVLHYDIALKESILKIRVYSHVNPKTRELTRIYGVDIFKDMAKASLIARPVVVLKA